MSSPMHSPEKEPEPSEAMLRDSRLSTMNHQLSTRRPRPIGPKGPRLRDPAVGSQESTQWAVRVAAALCAALLLLDTRTAAAAEVYEAYAGGDAAQQISAPLFVVLAYSAIWLAVLGYLVLLWRRAGQVREELHRMEGRLRGQPGQRRQQRTPVPGDE